MSIWCSWNPVGYEEPEPRRRDARRRGEVRSYANGWSNHYPTRDGKVECRASVDIAHIAPWCTPGWQQKDPGLPNFTSGDRCEVAEWLRLTVYTRHHDFNSGEATNEMRCEAVVMDEEAVRALVADMTAWLDLPKVHPIEETK